MKQSKAEKFMEAFSDIDEKFLKEAMDYKMKKRFNFKPIIAAAACAVFALAAIPVATHFAGNPPVQSTQGTQATPSALGASGKFTAYEMGTHSSDNVLNAEHETEMLINKGGKVLTDKSKIGKTKTITFGGKSFTGKYTKTKMSDYYGDDNDWYEGETFTFTINTATGVCTYFYAAEEELDKTEKYTQDECFAIAVKYLEQYVDDAEAYELKYVYERDWENGYYFMMYRTVDGIATSDRVSIGVRKTGEVYTHTFHSLGEMKDVDVSAINREALNKVIAEKVSKIYKNNYDLSHEMEHLELVKLADGSFAFDCTIVVSGKNTSEGKILTDTCFIGVTIDK